MHANRNTSDDRGRQLRFGRPSLRSHTWAFLRQNQIGVPEVLKPPSLQVASGVQPLDASDTPSPSGTSAVFVESVRDSRNAPVQRLDDLALPEPKYTPSFSFE